MVHRSEDAGCHEHLERWLTRADGRGYYPVQVLATLSDVIEIAFLVESGVNLTLQTGGRSSWLTVLDLAAQCLSVDMCAYLVELNVLDADDVLYVLIRVIDAHTAMGRRSVAIVYLLLSTGEFNADVAGPGGDSLLSSIENYCPANKKWVVQSTNGSFEADSRHCVSHLP
jgi:hypothetical protein